MYYYIFDIKKCKKRSQVENIKNYLGILGISGEFTYPSAAQSVKELVDLGLSKQYTTIVAIGDDEIANSVASVLVGRQEAMGFIPLEASPDLTTLIGTNDWKVACEILRYRKINEINLGKTANGECFLTSINLNTNNPVEVTLEFKDYILQTMTKDLTISNFNPGVKKLASDHLDIVIRSIDPKDATFSAKIASFFGGGKKESDVNMTLIHARSLRIFTKTQTALTCRDTIIAKTPQLIESTDQTLRIITAKKALDFWNN